ncbi:hypothetical protein BKA63DRAFT_300109 [Paraphoma chrysanthemicola]|nr:hypothetical protein BKA63DRAFT_300109 [Paraphoma chrysanthemicola]
MDGLSAAASIWSLAQATGALVKYFSTAKSGNKDIKHLQRELATLNSLLITLINLKFHFERSQTSQEWNGAIRVLGVDHGPFAECADTMAQLHRKITSRNGVRAIAMWPFIKDDAQDMLNKIERLKSVISLVLSVDQLKLSDRIITEVKELGTKLSSSHDRERLQEALSWISSLNFRTQQDHHKSFIEKDNGTWFLRSQEFELWLEQPGQTLFCPGIPGAGKTMMAATAIDHIESKILDLQSNNNIAYIFCDYNSEQEQSVQQLLGALVQQLVQNYRDLAGLLLVLHEAHAEKKTFPSIEEITNTLQSMMLEHTDVYVIVDAIDECSPKSRKRRQFISALQRLQTTTDTLHLLVTSRFTPEIVEAFKSSPLLEIKAHVDDVRNYVQGRIQDFRAPLRDDWQTKVEDAVIGSTNGMFLLARFLVDRFANFHTLKQVKQLVNDLAKDSNTPKSASDIYQDMYRAIMRRIQDQAVSEAQLAKKALMWISNAARLLTVQELCTALSIELEDTEFDEDQLLAIDLIVSVCAGLVVVEKGSNLVRLVHFTAQEFFNSLDRDWRQAEQLEMARICLTYLCFDEFKMKQRQEAEAADNEAAELFRMGPGWLLHVGGLWGSGWGHGSYDSIRSGQIQEISLPVSTTGGTTAFLNYAANFWALHARACQSDVEALALRLLVDQYFAAHAFVNAKSLHDHWAYLRINNGQTSTRITGLHLVAATGLEHLCRKLLDLVDTTASIHADAKDDGGRTALIWAAHHGHEEVVKMLLARDDVRHDREDHRRDIALNYAARQGQTAVVRLLTETERVMTNNVWNSYAAHVMTHTWERHKIRYWVCRENAFGETAIVLAALEGHAETVRLLHEHDEESLNREVMFGLWPIHIAAQRRPASVMKLLIDDYNVAADIEDPKGYSPFVLAADWNNEEIVRYFLQEKKQLLEDRPDMVVKAAKVAAANWKRGAILKLIVEEAGSIFTRPHLDELLDAAVSAGNVNIAIFLAAKKAELGTEQ